MEVDEEDMKDLCDELTVEELQAIVEEEYKEASSEEKEENKKAPVITSAFKEF